MFELDNDSGINLSNFREKFLLAESLTRASMSCSPNTRKKMFTKELPIGHLDEKSGDFVPPKQLLIYLVRMGSISSAPKILNTDVLDHDVNFAENISRDELLHFCQRQPGVHPMIKRAFKRADDAMDEYGMRVKKLNTVTRGCGEYISDPNTLRVLQWNILSQALGQMNDNFVNCPQEALEWNIRRYLIVEELIEYCPDIMCLQEVDHFNFLNHILSTQGYDGMFFPKPDSPCIYIHGNNGPDGCAIFFRKDKFDLVKAESKILEIWRVQSNQVALMMILKIKETGQEVCVITTHLKARNGALLSTLRNEQGKDLLSFVQKHCENRPLVICGDFNAEPVDPVYNTVLDSSLDLGSAYADCDKHQEIRSCYREPEYTTWKIRDEGEVCHTIDYIFYSKKNLEVEAVLQLPTGLEIGDNRVPSYSYPSDHFSLVCDFKINNNGHSN